jgi:hypothetical protein
MATTTTTAASAPKKLNLEQLRKKDREMVKGIFKFYEVPGGEMAFSFKKYKEDPVEHFRFKDNQVYTIPRGVAKHLNTNGWYPEYGYIKIDGVHNTSTIVNKVHRFGFQSLEFMDEDMIDVTSFGPSAIQIAQIA